MSSKIQWKFDCTASDYIRPYRLFLSVLFTEMKWYPISMEMRIVSLLLKDLGLRWGSTIGDIDPPSKRTFDVQLNFNWFCLFCVHFSLIVSNIEFHNVQYLPYPLNILNYKSCWLLFSFLFFPSLPNMVLSERWSGCSLQSSHAEVSFQVLIQRFGSKHAAGTLGKEYIAQGRL